MRRSIIDKRYKILKKLGSGAMGVVYRVKDLKDNNIIALKILSGKKTSSETVQRFKREFRLLSELHHPNLCSVYDFGTLKDGCSYFTMEYVNGEDIFKATEGLSYKKIYPWVVQLCRVLEYIHSRGLIHYDIKPSNVLVNNTGCSGQITIVKLMDFGLAREHRIKSGALIRGTFPYIAPEIIKGSGVDHRADFYSLGMLLRKILIRKLPRVKDETSFATILQIWERSTEPLSRIIVGIPKRLEQLVARLTNYEPVDRFSRANEIIKEINKISGMKFTLETEKTIEGYLLSSQFVGRIKEMELLKTLYKKTKKGGSGFVLIAGDAGSGKSRLLKEFKVFTQMEHGRCFMGYTHQDKIGPLEPFYDIFKELINHLTLRPKLSYELKLALAVLFKIFPDLAIKRLRKKLPKLAVFEQQQEKLRNFDALTKLIIHCATNLSGLVILLEDLHWADDLSIQFLEYLGRNLDDKKILICGTSRNEELKKNSVLQKMIITFKSENIFHKIMLKPLKFRSIYSLLDSTITRSSNSPELARYLTKKTGGNPFFVEEILRTLLRKKKVRIGERIELKDLRQITIPRAVEDLALKRITDLDRNPQEVVKLASIILRDFSYHLVKHLTELGDSELSRVLRELKRRQLLSEENNKYRFYHTTLRETIIKKLGNREKRELNYRVGRVLEKINKARVEAVTEDLAHYFINAKDRNRGVSYGLRAAKKSSDRYASEQAINFYRGVLDILGNKKLKRRFNILLKMADSERRFGYYDEAIKHYYDALSFKSITIDKEIDINLKISSVYESKGEYDKMLYLYQKVKSLFKKIKPSRSKTLLQVYTYLLECRLYFKIGDYKRAVLFDFNRLQILRNLKSGSVTKFHTELFNLTGAVETYRALRGIGDFNEAISYYEEAYRCNRKLKNEYGIAVNLSNLGNTHYLKFNYQKSIKCYQKSIKIAEKIGNQYGLLNTFRNLGILLFEIGQYSKALNYFQKSFTIAKKISNITAIGQSLQGFGFCFLKLCNYKKAKEYCEKSLDILSTPGWKTIDTVDVVNCIGDINQALGNYSSALRFYRKALKISKDIGWQFYVASMYINISSVFIELGELLKARKSIENALKNKISPEWKNVETDSCIMLCRLNIIFKDYDTANDYYNKGIKIARKIGCIQRLVRLLLLASEINFYKKKYIMGAKIAKKVIKMTKKRGTKDLHVRALLSKIKNDIEQGILTNIEIIQTLDEAKSIVEEIGCPEILWKVYFEYGRFFKNSGQYLKALDCYERCNTIFGGVASKIKNNSHKKAYLNHPDRQSVIAAVREIKELSD